MEYSGSSFLYTYIWLIYGRPLHIKSDRKLRYLGQATEIKGVERNGKQIDVILENEKRLPVYDIETSNEMEAGWNPAVMDSIDQ